MLVRFVNHNLVFGVLKIESRHNFCSPSQPGADTVQLSIDFTIKAKCNEVCCTNSVLKISVGKSELDGIRTQRNEPDILYLPIIGVEVTITSLFVKYPH